MIPRRAGIEWTRYKTTIEAIGMRDAIILVIQQVTLRTLVSSYPMTPCNFERFMILAQPQRNKFVIAFSTTQPENGSSFCRGHSVMISGLGFTRPETDPNTVASGPINGRPIKSLLWRKFYTYVGSHLSGSGYTRIQDCWTMSSSVFLSTTARISLMEVRPTV